MIPDHALVRRGISSRLISVTLYIGLLAGLIGSTVLSVTGILERRASLADNVAVLDQLKSRRLPGRGNAPGERAGSPFLEGPTATVAGAALQQRVAGAIAQFGGTVQSSQVDVQGAAARDGFISLLVSCEMPHDTLQSLLYDIEAGMPFLYVDQLDVQMPQGAAADAMQVPRVRILLGVSGKWQGLP